VTPEVRAAFERILLRLDVNGAFVQGDAFHRYDRTAMREKMEAEAAAGNTNFSHFHPDANFIDKLEDLFSSFGTNGTGQHRSYVHTQEDAERHSEHFGLEMKPGKFTPWEDVPANTDMLLYQGLHGMLKTDDHDISQHVDLGIGMVPIINLEWIKKIERDQAHRGYTHDEVVASILRRMPDYVRYITPQFSRTDINFQRVPVVDTSNPFITRDVPTLDESVVVIRFRRLDTFNPDFPYLLDKIPNSFMSRRNSIVVPGGMMTYAMELILEPILASLLEKRQAA
jgi:phosphoribulokinase